MVSNRETGRAYILGMTRAAAAEINGA